MLVGMPSGEFCNSPKVTPPRSKSRTTSNDHLSPTRSSVQATGQGERRKPDSSIFGLKLFSFPVVRVTCIVQVIMLYLHMTCKVQVTTKESEVTMVNTVVSHVDEPKVPAVSGTGTLVAVLFLAWLTLVFVLGARGVFVAPRGAPPFALLIGLVAPLSLFLVGYRVIRPLREFVLSADVRLIVGIQAWRWAGFGFLTLYTYGVLPGIFAWPAGLGDMAIGMTAPLVLVALVRRPGFAAGKTFVAWNLSGILDLTVAVSIGALVPLLAPNLYGAASTTPMTQLPLVLIPTYLVPTFLILHLTALFQARGLGR
jgi:hypothetical protein